MLSPSTLRFLKDLKKHNNKPWFDANRKQYEAAKADFAGLVEALIAETARFDPSVGDLTAKACMFRINRDVRFSKDKSPYKTNMGASINAGGKKTASPGYYFHCEPGGSFAAGGLYMPMPPDLARVRQEIDYCWDEWRGIVENKNFRKYFPAVEGIQVLSRPPKGYNDDNPAIAYLKMKSFIVSRSFSDGDLTSRTLVKEAGKTFRAMQPMIAFLQRALGDEGGKG